MKSIKKIVLKQNKQRMLVWKNSNKKLWQRKLKDKLKLKPERLKFSLVNFDVCSLATPILTYTFIAMAGGYDKQAAMDKRRALRPGKKNKKDKKTATMATMGADGQSTTVQA